MMITPTVGKFDVSWILTNGGSSCDIMYFELFKKMGLGRSNLWPCEGFDLQAFNGYIELVVSVGNEKDVQKINS